MSETEAANLDTITVPADIMNNPPAVPVAETQNGQTQVAQTSTPVAPTPIAPVTPTPQDESAAMSAVQELAATLRSDAENRAQAQAQTQAQAEQAARPAPIDLKAEAATLIQTLSKGSDLPMMTDGAGNSQIDAGKAFSQVREDVATGLTNIVEKANQSVVEASAQTEAKIHSWYANEVTPRISNAIGAVTQRSDDKNAVNFMMFAQLGQTAIKDYSEIEKAFNDIYKYDANGQNPLRGKPQEIVTKILEVRKNYLNQNQPVQTTATGQQAQTKHAGFDSVAPSNFGSGQRMTVKGKDLTPAQAQAVAAQVVDISSETESTDFLAQET